MKSVSNEINHLRAGSVELGGLYKALGEQGNPSFATVIKVMHALGLQFNVGARPVQG
ncbi:DNA-binding protein [Rhodoferax antarcticus]|uniref:helix-turn-helix domain-containing transcriptional regulator n=1 Tax=Rhodoferax antarcticus TaxID=81479 RepID=UPI003B84ACAE